MTVPRKDQEFLEIAIDEAIISARKNGGPFGAVMVKDGEIIARSHNTVTRDHDPTAHAEVNVIREAAKKLGTHDLSGTILYASCEPCPMCMAAGYWAHVDRIVFAATRKDAANAGFLDENIYHELCLPHERRKIRHDHIPVTNHLLPFNEWENNSGKIPY